MPPKLLEFDSLTSDPSTPPTMHKVIVLDDLSQEGLDLLEGGTGN